MEPFLRPSRGWHRSVRRREKRSKTVFASPDRRAQVDRDAAAAALARKHFAAAPDGWADIDSVVADRAEYTDAASKSRSSGDGRLPAAAELRGILPKAAPRFAPTELSTQVPADLRRRALRRGLRRLRQERVPTAASGSLCFFRPPRGISARGVAATTPPPRARYGAVLDALLDAPGLLAENALLVFDNTLWKGRVAEGQTGLTAAEEDAAGAAGRARAVADGADADGADAAEKRARKAARRDRAIAQALHEFNVKLRKETRVDQVVVPLRDGLTVATVV